MTYLDQLRMMEAAAQLCEADNMAEAEALRLVWLMNRRFDAPAEVQPQLPLLATQESDGR